MKEQTKQKNNYIFPDALGTWMAKIDLRTQYEGSMLSMLFIMIGLIIMAVYSIFYTDVSLFMKIMIGINGFFGVLFMWSFLVTTFQQYKNYIDLVGIQKIIKEKTEEIKSEEKLDYENERR